MYKNALIAISPLGGPAAAKLMEETGCDMVMVGRGALGRPWVFSQINAYLKEGVILPEPPVSERMRVMVKHIQRICEYKGERIGIREARKHAAWYIKGVKVLPHTVNRWVCLKVLNSLKN